MRAVNFTCAVPASNPDSGSSANAGRGPWRRMLGWRVGSSLRPPGVALAALPWAGRTSASRSDGASKSRRFSGRLVGFFGTRPSFIFVAAGGPAGRQRCPRTCKISAFREAGRLAHEGRAVLTSCLSRCYRLLARCEETPSSASLAAPPSPPGAGIREVRAAVQDPALLNRIPPVGCGKQPPDKKSASHDFGN